MTWSLSTLFNDLNRNPEVVPHEKKLHSLYKWLRENHPHAVAIDPEGVFDPVRVISRYVDVVEIEKKPEIFANYPYLIMGPKEKRKALVERLGRPRLFPLLLNMDPPEHTTYRKLTQIWFNPGSVLKLSEQIRSVANEHIDQIASRGECDFAQDITTWYPLHIMHLLLGIPRCDEELMMRLTQEFMSPDDPDTKSVATSLDPQVAMDAMADYFGAIIADRKVNPKDDLSTVIANAKIDGEEVPIEAKIGYLILIIVAGHDTTKFASSGGMYALLTHPKEMRKLRDDPDLLRPALEEMVRWTAPVRYFLRRATRDYQLGDSLIQESEYLMLLYGSACRDSSAIENADQFIIDRKPNRHIGFGRGIHQCLGQHLARLEMRILFEEMFKRFKCIELNGEAEGLQSNFVAGYKKVPIKYS